MSNSEQNPGCLSFLLRFFHTRALTSAKFPYRVRDNFLSPAELSFYRVLMIAVDGKAVVCPKVRLADIFFVTRPHENLPARNQIAQKHVDFLLCDVQTLKPLLGIEMDDSSHSRADRQQRDEWVDKAYAAAKLPLVHVAAQRAYNIREVSAFIKQAWDPDERSKTAPEAALAPQPAPNTPPLCPKCSVPMILRTASRGERSGEQFYGCPHYPTCRQIVNYITDNIISRQP